MTSWPEVWTWLNENASGVSAVSVAVTAVIAAGTLIAAARDSAKRSRPYVVAELAPAEHSTTSIVLIVKNYGQAAARQLTVSFDPAVPGGDDAALSPRLIAGRYRRELSHLGPGQALTNTWVTYVAAPGKGNELAPQWDVPATCTVTLRYRRGRWRWYSERYVLDTEAIGSTSTTVSSDSELGIRKSLAQNAGQLAAGLKQVADALESREG